MFGGLWNIPEGVGEGRVLVEGLWGSDVVREWGGGMVGGLTVDDWFLLPVEAPTFCLSAGEEDAEAVCWTSVYNNRRRKLKGVYASSYP